MSFSMNIHPKGEWREVRAEMWEAGHCIQIWATDESGYTVNPIFHLDSWKNKNEVLRLFKQAINSIPEFCDSCGQEVKNAPK